MEQSQSGMGQRMRKTRISLVSKLHTWTPAWTPAWIVCGDPETGQKANDTPKDQFFIVSAH